MILHHCSFILDSEAEFVTSHSLSICSSIRGFANLRWWIPSYIIVTLNYNKNASSNVCDFADYWKQCCRPHPYALPIIVSFYLSFLFSLSLCLALTLLISPSLSLSIYWYVYLSLSLSLYHSLCFSFSVQISMGQGQADVALAALRESSRNGDWLCLKNLHLVTAWLPQLEKVGNGN